MPVAIAYSIAAVVVLIAAALDIAGVMGARSFSQVQVVWFGIAVGLILAWKARRWISRRWLRVVVFLGLFVAAAALARHGAVAGRAGAPMAAIYLFYGWIVAAGAATAALASALARNEPEAAPDP